MCVWMLTRTMKKNKQIINSNSGGELRDVPHLCLIVALYVSFMIYIVCLLLMLLSVAHFPML